MQVLPGTAAITDRFGSCVPIELQNSHATAAIANPFETTAKVTLQVLPIALQLFQSVLKSAIQREDRCAVAASSKRLAELLRNYTA